MTYHASARVSVLQMKPLPSIGASVACTLAIPTHRSTDYSIPCSDRSYEIDENGSAERGVCCLVRR